MVSRTSTRSKTSSRARNKRKNGNETNNITPTVGCCCSHINSLYSTLIGQTVVDEHLAQGEHRSSTQSFLATRRTLIRETQQRLCVLDHVGTESCRQNQKRRPDTPFRLRAYDGRRNHRIIFLLRLTPS